MRPVFSSSVAQQILQKYWNYPNFRTKQQEVINALAGGHNVIALMPTGGGKSICYQVPAIVYQGLTVVVSPLISLMEDQVTALKSLGIRAEAVHSGHTYSNIDRILDNCIYGDTKMLYVSPERLHHDLFKERIKKIKVDLVAIDEAHCISQWGHDFRPSYLDIRNFIDECQPRCIIALTATATNQVITELKELIFDKEPKVIKGSFLRSNIAIKIVQSDDKISHILKSLAQGRKTIIYVRSRRRVEMIAEILRNHKYRSAFYHAGLHYKDKKEIQANFKDDMLDVVVATNAFGMGIDISNIHSVIHYEVPPSIEEYYQEIGRAGRDGQDAYATLLLSKDNLTYSKRRLTEEYPDFELSKKIYKAVHVYYNIGLNEGEGTSKPINVKKLAKDIGISQRKLMNVLNLWQRIGTWELVQHHRSRVYCNIIYTPQEVRNIVRSSSEHYFLLDYFMRHYEYLFDGWIQLDVEKDSRTLKISEERYSNALHALAVKGIVRLYKLSAGQMITFVKDRVSNNYLLPYKIKYQSLKIKSHERWKGVQQLVESDQCRMNIILEYFGEEPKAPCGICDRCIADSTTTMDHSDLLLDQRIQNEKHS